MSTRTPKREWTHQSISVEYKQIPILRQPGILAKRESLCRKSTYATRYQMTVSRARSTTNLDRILAMLIKLLVHGEAFGRHGSEGGEEQQCRAQECSQSLTPLGNKDNLSLELTPCQLDTFDANVQLESRKSLKN